MSDTLSMNDSEADANDESITVDLLVVGSGAGGLAAAMVAAKHGAKVTIDDAHPGNNPPGALFTVDFSSTRA